jgi:hypothetical protein
MSEAERAGLYLVLGGVLTFVALTIYDFIRERLL